MLPGAEGAVGPREWLGGGAQETLASSTFCPDQAPGGHHHGVQRTEGGRVRPACSGASQGAAVCPARTEGAGVQAACRGSTSCPYEASHWNLLLFPDL